MSKIAAAGVLILAFCLPVSVGALGRSTVDPNAGKPECAVEAPSSSDVAQKVTYEARRKTVVSIIEDLSRMTGVTLKAGYNNDDWQVRDRRMNIFARDILLANLMDSIARVMKFHWSKTEKDNGIVSYRLYMDRKVLLGAERERLLEEEKIRKRQGDKRQKLLSGLEALSKMSEAELEELKTKSPYLYSMAKNSVAALLPQLFEDIPVARDYWVSGDELTIRFDQLSVDMQQRLGQYEPNETKITIVGKNDPGPGIASVRFEYSSPPRKGIITASYADPDSVSANIGARLSTALLDQINKAQFVADITEAGVSDDAVEKKYYGEPLIEHPSDAALSAKVKIQVDGYEVSGALAALAESASYAVVSDSFDRYHMGLSFPEGEIEVRAILDKLESACRYNWEKHGSILEFHDRDWFRKRAAQIPDAWMENWRKVIKDNGLLGIGELSQIAILTPEQFRANMLPDDVLGASGLAYPIAANKDLLNLYAILDRQQRALIFTGEGLALSSVINDHAEAVRVLLRRCPALREISKEGLRLAGTREKSGKQTQYIFRLITPAGNTTGLPWKIACPVYNSPKQKKQTDGKADEAEQQRPKQ